MIVNWLPASPTSFEANFNGSGLVLDKDINGDWHVYVSVNGKLKKANVSAPSASQAKAKVELIAEATMKKLVAASPQARQIAVVRKNKPEDVALPKTQRRTTKRKQAVA